LSFNGKAPRDLALAALGEAAASCRAARGSTPRSHPSSILRAPDEETRRAQMGQFIEDLKVVARALRESGRAA
jgi:hypothetical protein